MRHLLAIGGKPRSGKDTLADSLTSLSPSIRSVTLSSLLFADLSALLGIPADYFPANKEEARPMLQWFGEVYYKRLKRDPAYFVRRALAQLAPAQVAVVVGVRRPNELSYLKEHAEIRDISFTSIYVRRAGLPEHTHPVENALTEEDFEATLDNSGKIETLHNLARRLAENKFGICLSQ